MLLFPLDTEQNLLPYDGTVLYYGKMFSQESADKYYSLLMDNIEWRHDEAIILGKHIVTARKVAWYADTNIPYTYSGITKKALPWTKELLELKQIAELHTNAMYNACLLNLYHNGNEGMAYHSDDEKALSRNAAIASFSFGAERKFLFKHKRDKQTISVLLEQGSLLVMKDETQDNWLHRLPPTAKVSTPRINLTFRKMMV